MDESGDIPELALAWHQAGRGVALATVIQTWGSAPRAVGAQLVVDENGAIEGSVSGGCVEGAVVMEAMEALEDGAPRELEFGVSDDDAFAVGLACGGTIRILVQPVGGALPEDVLAELVSARAERRAVALESPLVGGMPRLIPADGAMVSALDREAQRFTAVYAPPLRMIIVGAVHIAQALIPMARTVGFDLTVIDPRPSFLSPERFPGEDLRDGWPDEVMAGLSLDPGSAVVTLTHDPKIDDPALEAALASDAFYIGCLGSRRTHGKRLERLTAAGFSEEALNRLHAPIGLDIGAVGPAEIAVSILAEIVQRRRGR